MLDTSYAREPILNIYPKNKRIEPKSRLIRQRRIAALYFPVTLLKLALVFWTISQFQPDEGLVNGLPGGVGCVKHWCDR